RIPAGDIVDVFAQNPPETRHLQRDAMHFVRHLTAHGEFEPYLNAPTAIRRAERVAEELAKRFEPIPSGIDPIVDAANKRAAFTVSDIKADAGGKVGHTAPPNHFAGRRRRRMLRAPCSKSGRRAPPRVFLAFETEAEAAQRLLGATDKFNFKRVWTRKAA